MKIGNVYLKNNLILAPMAGVTDFAFRSMAVLAGADFCFTEMVSAKAIKYKSKKTLDLLTTANNESIKAVQIFGSDAKIMAEIVKSEHLKKFDIIDINMGCPAPKIVNNGEGSALLKDLALAESIVTSCVAATDKPITVKFRSGWDEHSIVAVEFAKMCERAGASAITIHGRSREQFFSGVVNYDIIKDVVNAVSIPIIANGDVFDVTSYHNLLATGCATVMVGRGALGNPQIFSTLLDENKKLSTFECIKFHISSLLEIYPENYVVKYMRKHIMWYLGGAGGTKEIKNRIIGLNTTSDVLAALSEFYGQV